MAARLYIVRHGNTFEKGDVVRRVGGRSDISLSLSGRSQIQALAGHFAGQGMAFATIRSGPLRRTRETAEIIRTLQSAPPETAIDLFLREIDYGPDEGKSEIEVVARLGQAALDAWEQASIVPPGWRVDPQAIIGNWQELFARMRAVTGNHLIVTSNGVARFALAAAGNGRPDRKLATGAYGVIELDGATVTVLSWNARP
ncbi:MAG: histidine phosphatase family protein [Alphaproteobacteria bacterium]|nr:histidine phosphatase family protein [Alphaproteobacteria bacterium]